MEEQIQYLDYEGLLRYDELLKAYADSGKVRFDKEQSLTDAQKTQARSNIGAISSLSHTITVKSGKKSDGSTDITATSSSATSPSVTLGDSGVTANGYGDSTNQTPSYGATFKVPYIKVNAQGIVVDASEHTVKIPASDNTNTATAADNILDGSNSGTQITYAPYTTQLDKLSFDTSTTAPARTDRLNLNGYLYATKLYSGGTEVLTSHLSISHLAPKASPALTGTPTAPTAAAGTNTTQIATTAFVLNEISGLANAMVFIGTIGKASNGSGTVSTIPTSDVKIGHTYKIVDENKSIAAANSATGSAVTAKIGDTIVATATTPKWVVIPSGDEPSGTVTSVAVSNGGGLSVSGSPVTSSGTITISHADTSSLTSVNNSGRTYIQDITLDEYGHVTALASATETVTNTNQTVKGAGTAFGTNDAVDIVAGSNVSVTADTSAKTITIAATDTTYESKAAASGGTDLSLVTTGEKATWNAKTSNTGTVTKVTAGTGLSVGTTSGGNFTTSGTINHTNSVTAQTTQAVYPIKIDACGHISAYGSAVTIPAAAANGTFSIKTKVGSAAAVTAADFTANQSSADDVTFIQGDNIVLTTNTSSRTITIGASMPVISHGTVGSATLDSTKQIDALFITT